MSTFPRWFIICISILLFLLVAWFFSNIIAYLLIAGILSFIGHPIVDFISTRRIKKFTIPRGVAALITMMLMLLVLVIFASFFIPMVTNEAQIIANIDTGQLIASLSGPIDRLEVILR